MDLQRAAPDPETAPRARSARPRRTLLHFLSEFRRALVDEATYDLRANPTLAVGFLMALPIPFLVWAAQAPAWLLLVSLPAPLFWGVVLGAAGRVGIRAEREARRLQAEVAAARTQTEAVQAVYEEALVEEVERREGLERKEEVVRSELKLAEAVHRTLLPDSIQRPDVEVAVRQIPSEFVGGDYLYASVVGKRYLYLCIGDVSGHGVSAALVVARLHGMIRRLTLAKRSKPVTILDQLNRAALEIFKHTYFFLTFAVFRLDLETGKLRYATAGHPAQILVRRDGRIQPLRTPNRLLGMDADIFDAHHPSDRVQLDPGDSLVLFTDGLFEIQDRKTGAHLGEQGLHERIQTMQGLTPALMAGEILQDLADFQGRSTFNDDVSLMVVTYRGRSAASEESAG
jgi:serine phosphatase RsbU (regulator of sigma subunit)